jgi:hypothetical protein
MIFRELGGYYTPKGDFSCHTISIVVLSKGGKSKRNKGACNFSIGILEELLKYNAGFLRGVIILV